MPTRCFWPPESFAGKAVDLVRQPDALQQRFGFLADLGLVALEHVDRGFHHVLQHGHVRPQRKMLEDHADPGANGGKIAIGHAHIAVRAYADPLSGKIDGAAVGLLQPVDAAQ